MGWSRWTHIGTTVISLSGLLVWVLLASALPGSAAAQEAYPSKPIRVIVPSTAGSASDVFIRMAGQQLLARLGQPFIVESRPGGEMTVGTAACAKSPPDGYTLCLVSNDAMSSAPYRIPQLPYDPERDFRPITNLFFLIPGLMAAAALPVKSAAELRSLAASRPGALNTAVLGGAGSTGDMFRRWLGDIWKTRFASIPYKGGSQIIAALASGEVDFARIGLANLGGQISSGKIRILAVQSAERVRRLPDVPTFAEIGIDGFPGGWFGLVAPAAAPAAVVARINSEFLWLSREPKFEEFAQNQFFELAVGTPEAFAAFMKRDRDQTGRLIRQYGK